jgi:hypothetical protein
LILRSSCHLPSLCPVRKTVISRRRSTPRFSEISGPCRTIMPSRGPD